MNNKNLKSIIATASTTVLGISGLFLVPPVKLNAFEPKPESTPETPKSLTISRTSTSPIQEFVATKIYQHRLANQEAATLYFKGLPLLTFLSPPQKEANKENSADNPLLKAERLAEKLEQLSQKEADANKIKVSWNKTTKSYSIKFQEEELVNINEKTILPDTTENLETDALQATNRLRRLLGNAAPLKEVAGKPKGQKTSPVARAKHHRKGFRGLASWYGPKFHGRRTANGEKFNQHALTAAHRSFPFGTKVKVTNVRNGRSVIVRINDRGPFSGGRIIDLSRGAAKILGLLGSGTAPVTIQILR
jgi:rare lipoprotein A